MAGDIMSAEPSAAFEEWRARLETHFVRAPENGPVPFAGGHLTPPPPIDTVAASDDAGGPAWSREWPTVAGWYWFYQDNGRLDPVHVMGVGGRSDQRPSYVRGAGLMYPNRAQPGLWQRIPDPVLP